MDRERERVDLMRAKKPIAAGMRHIADQEQRVSELDRQGHDTTQAVSLLALYRRVQDQYVAQGNLISSTTFQPDQTGCRRFQIDIGLRSPPRFLNSL
jgi:hypothetical protein